MAAQHGWSAGNSAEVGIEEVLQSLKLERFLPRLAKEDITNLKGLEYATEQDLKAMVPPLGPRRLLGRLIDEVFRNGQPPELSGNKYSDFFTTPQHNDPITAKPKKSEMVTVGGQQVRAGWAFTEEDAAVQNWTGTLAGGRGGGGGGFDGEKQPVHPISQKLQDRQDARREKDYTKADQIREELQAEGVQFDDDTRTWEDSEGTCGGWGRDLLYRGTWTTDSVPDFVQAIPRGGKGGGKGGGGGGGARAGDWTCSCGFNNYASRSECKSCGSAKQEGAATEGATGGGGGGGDWGAEAGGSWGGGGGNWTEGQGGGGWAGGEWTEGEAKADAAADGW
eukprot:TRINITY_DN7474_c1_g3_i1.p3 TRINITY_DN7474_c1_g3~~TRINITY_DN7474_c1_g3_i1.p3  ORF type:complete len:336 (+),score=112.49 TRINITY_DN7474_c1_g3_i1:87-1094(+)